MENGIRFVRIFSEPSQDPSLPARIYLRCQVHGHYREWSGEAEIGDVLEVAQEHYEGYHQGDLDAGAMQG